MSHELTEQLRADTLAMVARAARMGFERVAETLELEAVEHVMELLNAGAHLEVRVQLQTPPAMRVMLVTQHDEREIGVLVAKLPKDRLQ